MTEQTWKNISADRIYEFSKFSVKYTLFGIYKYSAEHVVNLFEIASFVSYFNFIIRTF